jgi:2-dehydropantoate 2-reductase
MSETKIADLGVGGVGGCIAAILSDSSVPVTCVDTERTVSAVRKGGLILESQKFGKLVTHPESVQRLEEPTDILFVTTKAVHLDAAMENISPSAVKSCVIIPLLNGLEHVERIRKKLGKRVAAGSIRIESKVLSPGRISHTSPFTIVKIASDKDVSRDKLAEIAAFLSSHGIETHVELNEATVLWDKLARLVALACTTALTDRPIGFIRSDVKWRGVLESAVKEAIAVAKTNGVTISVEEQMKILDSMPESLTSSLQRDISAGKQSELDAIAGAVVRAGKKHNVECPVLGSLITRIEKEKINSEGASKCRQQ